MKGKQETNYITYLPFIWGCTTMVYALLSFILLSSF